MKMNKKYVAPQINVEFVATGDVITVSAEKGHDSLDNWMNDVFSMNI